jgi:hypothetical protein
MNDELKGFLANAFDEYSSNNNDLQELFFFLQRLRRLSPFLLIAYLDIVTTIIREPVPDSPTMRRAESLICLSYYERLVTILAIALSDAKEAGLLKINEENDIWMVVEDRNFFLFMDDYLGHRTFRLQDQREVENFPF